MTETSGPSPVPRSRLRRARPWLIALALLVVGLPLAGYAALLAFLRTDSLRPRIEAAVEAATGRALTLSAVTLRPALVPTLSLEGAVLANPPGFSRPEMLRVRRIEVEVALVPLLSRQVELRRLTLVEPDLLLETDAGGRANWQFARPPQPDAPPPGAAPAAPAEPAHPFGLEVGAVALERGRVTWRSPGREEVLELPRLTLRTAERAIVAEGQAVARGVTATVNGGTGPLATLLAGAAGDWPFRLGISAPGMNAEANGTLALPLRPDAWQARLAATADTAARLAPFLPGTALPEARNLSLVAEATGAAGLTALHVSVAEAALAVAGRPLRIGPAQVSATPDAPISLDGTLHLGGLPLTLAAQGPRLAEARAGGAIPLAVTITGEGLSATARGALAAGGGIEGTEWRFGLQAADLRALGARAGTALPGLHDAVVEGQLRVVPGGGQIPAFTLTSREAAGEASGTWRQDGALPRITLRARLERVDADSLLAPAPAASAAEAALAAPAPSPAPPPQAAPPAARPDGRVIPDTPIDLSAIRDAPLALDAEATLAALRLRGADWREVSLRAVLDGRALKVERFAGTTPGGPISGSILAEAGATPPRLALDLRSGEGGVDPAPLLASLGAHSPVSGHAALDLSLRGAGSGLRALAGSLEGHLGLAMTGGRLDPRLLAGATTALRGIVPEGTTASAAEIRCLALRFDLGSGVAQSRALLVQTGVASTTGAGAANLADETLAFRLRPVIRVGEVSLTTPLGITGRFGSPRVSVDPNAATAAAAGVLGGLAQRSGDDNAAAIGNLVEGLLGGRNAPPPAADCAGQLALARGAAPAVGAPPPPPAEAPRDRRPQVQDLLRGLLGR
ncbi:AsmA family protein [Roseomonas sp. WA12]